ncbi:MAG: hypothetical protein Q9174_003119 [Haloplaca sp. 1 TL-2023]
MPPTMTQPVELDGLDRIPIAQLGPLLQDSSGAINGVVTLIWPYSASKRTFSVLLAEPDIRLRRQRGQVRIHFAGSSARVAAKCNIQSGDTILLSLLGVQWEKDTTASSTPGRGIGWEIRFAERAFLKILRDGLEPVVLDIDHPAPSPEARIRSPPPVGASPTLQFPSTPIRLPATPALHQAWSTPAFLKRDRLSTTSFFGSDYDPFNEDDFRDNNRRKKTKFGRASNQWRFTEQSSSPESVAQGEHSALEQSVTVIDQVNGQKPIPRPQTPNGSTLVLSATDVASSGIDHVIQIQNHPGVDSNGTQRQSDHDLADRNPDEQIAVSNPSDRYTVPDEPSHDPHGSEVRETVQQQEESTPTEEKGAQPVVPPQGASPTLESNVVDRESPMTQGQSEPFESQSNRVQSMAGSASPRRPDAPNSDARPQNHDLVLPTEVHQPQLEPTEVFHMPREEERAHLDGNVPAAGPSRPDAYIAQADRLDIGADQHHETFTPSVKAWEAPQPGGPTFGMPDKVANDAANMDNEATLSEVPSGVLPNDQGPASATPEPAENREVSSFSIGARTRSPKPGVADDNNSAVGRRASAEMETSERFSGDEESISAREPTHGTELPESTSQFDFASVVGTHEDSSKKSDSTTTQTRSKTLKTEKTLELKLSQV